MIFGAVWIRFAAKWIMRYQLGDNGLVKVVLDSFALITYLTVVVFGYC